MSSRPRPDVGEVFRPRPEEVVERSERIAPFALLAGPALVIAAVALFFVAYPIAFLALFLAPGVLSLGWRPGGSPSRARAVTLVTAVALGLAVGALGLTANPCVAEPSIVALLGGAASSGAFVVAVAAGRARAIEGGLVSPVLVAGALAVVVLGGTLFAVFSQVFVLC